MIKHIILLTIAITIICFSKLAIAQTHIKTSGSWSAFKDESGKNKLCYIASEPTKKTGNYKRRGDTYVLITQRPEEKKFDVFELRAGYNYKKNSTVIIDIADQKFDLFTYKNTAWARNSKTDRSLARAMIRGQTMTVTGISSRETKTLDTYSLKGFTMFNFLRHRSR